jgi:DNA-binding NtrC family response regulator
VILPALRERPREVALLARLFLDVACAEARRPAMTLSPAALRRLMSYGWPGNLRELRHAVRYAVAAVEESTIEPWHLPDPIGRAPAEPAARAAPVGPFRPIAEEIHDLERERMRQALEAAGGVQVRAADLIAMPLRTFTMKMKQYGLRRPGS